MRRFLLIPLLIFSLSCTQHKKEKSISTETLLKEMVDLKRLTNLPEDSYRTVQYSSYDRRSTKSSEKGWFSNEDGFGDEPIPGFEKVLKEADTSGVGEYLICDIQKPGAILRLWTAGIDGQIRLYLDDMHSPVYEGNAQDFFWKTIETLTSSEVLKDKFNNFRQFDATYFPIPFSKGCRIEWIGDIRKIHFYHVGIRVYNSRVNIETFKKTDFLKYAKTIDDIDNVFKNRYDSILSVDSHIRKSLVLMASDSSRELFNLGGSHAIEYFSIKINAKEIENVLRKTIVNIYFDDSSIPQVQAPIGDFFGSAPGINPYHSLPFSVMQDSTMICRFVMPFKHSAKVEIENYSGENIGIRSEIRTNNFTWEEGKTMHFRARWKISHDLIASSFDVKKNSVPDILYLMASGEGRIVGTAAYIYNPSNAITPWGNWWGEGDEKIYVDQDTFPSFFGTGSEDYFNYSWSSTRIFSYPYCGQPRNDGPGNRGYVSNFRWHISDDIVFKDKIAFFMELGHHGVVPDFSYGRIVYFYALPNLIDDYQKISMNDIRNIRYKPWKPIAYCGSSGFNFIQAENIISVTSTIRVEKEKFCADENILMWTPSRSGEKIKFQIKSESNKPDTKIGLTLFHCPHGGKFSIYLNGKQVKFDGIDTINLYHPNKPVLKNHFSESIKLNIGNNEVIFVSEDTDKETQIGIDFFWLKKS